MDWSNERYVRLYVRDSADLLAAGWEGRFVFYELLRHVDRAGVLDTGGDLDIVPEMIRVPADVFATGFARLKRRKVVQLTQGAIVIPNFLEAQESPASDAQRMREMRARRRDLAMACKEPEERQLALAPVTERNSGDTSRSPVLCCAEPSVLSRAVPNPPSPSDPEGGWGGVGSTSSDQESEQPLSDVGGSTADARCAPDARPTGVRQAPDVEQVTREVVGQFYGPLERESPLEAWQPLVGELLAEGYSREELIAIAWCAATGWADDPDRRAKAELDWALKPKSRLKRGGRTPDEWLAAAETAWREESPDKPPPWRAPPARRNGVHAAAGAAS